MNKFNIGEIVYVKVAYGQNQNVIGCGIITEIENIGLSRELNEYRLKFVESDGKGLQDFLMNGDTIDERDIYKIDDLAKLLEDLELNLDLQLELTQGRQENDNLQNNKPA